MDISILNNVKLPILIWVEKENTFVCEYSNNVMNYVKVGDSPSDENYWLYRDAADKNCRVEIAKEGCIISVCPIDEQNDQTKLLETHYPSEDSLSILYSINDKIRGPLTNIIGFTSLLERKELEDSNHKYVDIIKRSSNDVVNVVNDLVDIINLDKGNITPVIEDVRVGKLVSKLVRSVSDDIDDKNLQLEVMIDSTLPSRIYSDYRVLNRILHQLLTNAITNTEEGSIILSIRNNWQDNITSPYGHLTPSDGEFNILFEVYNQNKDIDSNLEDTLNSLLGLQSTGAITPYRGTGMGLIIVKKLVKLLGGEIWYSHKTGEGISFYFNIVCRKRV